MVNANLRTTNTLRPIREDSVDFDKTENIYIEGDNLEVLKILQESYLNKIKMIYIDPPYNTGNDFIYKDDFKKSIDELNLEEGNIDEQRNRLVANSNSSGRYHSDWLSMMYPRLKLARNLLTEDGVIFISIDDNEVHNLRKICDEIFGEVNFISTIIQNKQNAKNDTVNVQKNHEYILSYRKSVIYEDNGVKIKPTIVSKSEKIRDVFEENGEYYYLNDSITTRGEGGTLKARPNLGYTVYYNPVNHDKIAECDYNISKAQTAQDYNDIYETNMDLITKGYVAIRPPKVRGQLGVWTWSLEKFNQNKKDIIITGKEGSFAVKKRTFVSKESVQNINGNLQIVDYSITNVRSIWDYSTNDGTKLLNDVMNEANTFNNAKNLSMIKELISLVPNNNPIILDFFSGSGTTGHAVMQLNSEDGGNRKFIMVQIPEECDEKSEAFKAGYKNICEIGKERIRRAGKKIIEEQKQMLEAKKGELNKKMNGQMSLGNEKELEVEELRQEIESIEKKIKNLDCGFRVFRLDSSNMKDVYYMPKDYKQENLELFATNIKEDRETEDLIAQVMLDWGLELSKRIEKVEVAGKEVYKIENNALYCCFDEEIDEKFIRELAKVETHPLRIVFKDSSFKDDTAKENVAQLIKQLCPETEIKVI
ncbi:MAG: site-specific DNA-methyltransferase [Bacteroidales bacterium]|nr:site-specific DNA-methyltransferase [Bacteroidales bacterium]